MREFSEFSVHSNALYAVPGHPGISERPDAVSAKLLATYVARFCLESSMPREPLLRSIENSCLLAPRPLAREGTFECTAWLQSSIEIHLHLSACGGLASSSV